VTIFFLFFFLGNQIRSLPAEIGHLKSLTRLNVGFNKLESIPAEMAQCSSLTSLNISHNNLIVLFAEIGRLSSLSDLDISYNKLETLPDTLADLKVGYYHFYHDTYSLLTFNSFYKISLFEEIDKD
jgi:Leucine-rich repeat (LRR) protein